MKLLALFTFTIVCSAHLLAGTFTSLASGSWNGGAAVWTISGDADGIPDADDDIIIQSGHTITLVAGTHRCRDLTINSGGSLSGLNSYQSELKISGNYTNNGQELNNKATLTFRGAGSGTISGSGSFSPFFNLQFARSRVIDAGVTMTKSRWIRIFGAIAVTNRGSLLCEAPVIANNAGANFVNEGILTIEDDDFMQVGSFTASAVGNVVNIEWSDILFQDVPVAVSGYYDLNINIGSSFDAVLLGNTSVANDLFIAQGDLDLSTFDFNLGGDLNANGGQIRNGNSFTFDGSGTQTITTSGAYTNLIFRCPTTIDATSNVVSADTDLRFTQDLTIDGSLDLSGGPFDMILNGDLTVNGALTNGENTLFFNGSGAQNFNSAAATTCFNIDLDNSSSTSITGTVNMENLMTFNNGSDLDASGGTFTLLSSATRTAAIGNLSGGSSVSGAITAQRFISGGTADYRDITSPFASGPTIADLDDDIIISCPTCADGCAYGGGCFVSISTFDDATQTYVPITGPGQSFDNLRGYEAFLGDDLSGFTGATIDVSGSVNSAANLTYTVAQNGWSLIGNPYCSAIDIDDLSFGVSVGRYTYIYDASTGNYEYYDVATGTSSGSVSSDGIVTSGQGLWFTGGNGGAFQRTITITQNMKSSVTTTAFVRNDNVLLADGFDIKVVNQNSNYSCRSFVQFDENATEALDSLDILAFRGPLRPGNVRVAPFLFFKTSDNQEVRLNRMNVPNDVRKEIPLGFNSEVTGTFTISSKTAELFQDYVCVLLYDNQTGTYTNLKHDTYVFEHTGSEEDSDRFKLILSNEGMCDVFEQEDVAVKTNGFTFNTVQNNGTLKIQLEEHNMNTVHQVNIFNMTGQRVYSTTMLNSSIDINNSQLTSGVYVIEVSDGKVIEADKIVIQ